MRIFLTILASLFLLVAGVVLAFAVIFPTQSWRYKMTVSVETPEGIKAGSAVREVSVPMGPEIINLPEAGRQAEVKGEAVVVDLGRRGVLFALMTDFGGSENVAHTVVYNTIGGNMSPEGIRFLQNATGKKAVLEPRRYPMLVMFKDIKDPKTVTPVLKIRPDGGIKADHFEELFGTGVKLKEIAIEITDEEVTWRIEQYLPWLQSLHGGYLHGGSTSRGAPLGLYGGNFKTGDKK